MAKKIEKSLPSLAELAVPGRVPLGFFLIHCLDEYARTRVQFSIDPAPIVLESPLKAPASP